MKKSIRNAVGYARTSSNINPKSSIPNQCRLIKEYCEQNNIFLRDIYIDEAKTATKVEGRESYMKLMEALDYKDIDMVVVSFFDRLGREAFDFVLTFLDLNTKGIEIISITEGLTSKKISPIKLVMIAFEGEYENIQRKDRIHGSKEENRKKGIYNLPHIPLGYKKDSDSRLIVDVDKVLIIKRIFEKYLQYKSLYETSIIFKSMTDMQIARILENKTYTGYIYKKEVNENNELCYVKQSLISHPAIIDDTTFEKVRDIREGERQSGKRQVQSYLLKFIIKCPHCFSVMRTKVGMYYCHDCRKSKKKPKVEFEQESLEKKFLIWVKTLPAEMEKEMNCQPFNNPRIVEIEKRKRGLEERFSKAKISLTRYQDGIQELNNEIKKANEEKYSNNSAFHLKYELNDLIRNNAWGKLSRRMIKEKIYVTLDDSFEKIKLIING